MDATSQSQQQLDTLEDPISTAIGALSFGVTGLFGTIVNAPGSLLHLAIGGGGEEDKSIKAPGKSASMYYIMHLYQYTVRTN
jgi:hypothetical protein